MNYFFALLWLIPGMVMPYSILGIPQTIMTTMQALTWYLSAYVMGSIVIATCYELRKFMDSLRGGSMGSARFGGITEQRQADLVSGKGVIIGKAGGKILRFNKAGHLITISKTRGGKGVSSVIPNLLDHKGSVFCVDIKGENHSITSRKRSQFGKVFNLAPFESNSSCFNPLDFIRFGADEIDDASLIATLMVVPGEAGADSFWDKEARALITGLILYIVRHKPKEKQNLAEVRRLITLGEEDFNECLQAMEYSPHPWINRAASAFNQKAEKERSAVISTAQSHTKVFDSPRLTKITNHSDFNLEDMKREVMSVYLNIPPHQIAVYRPYLRLMVGLAQAAMTRSNRQPNEQVLFLLDEFPALGRMPIGGFSYLAGYGVRLWIFSQSLGQLEAIYGKQADGILSNCAVTQVWALAPADFKTAEHVSRTLGEKTITTMSENRSQKHRFGMVRGYSDNRSKRARRLLTPDEILCLPEKLTLLFVSGVRPFLVNRVVYYKDNRFNGLYDTWGNDNG